MHRKPLKAEPSGVKVLYAWLPKAMNRQSPLQYVFSNSSPDVQNFDRNPKAASDMFTLVGCESSPYPVNATYSDGCNLGLWLARPNGAGENVGVGTRSGGITALCKHASIAFLPSLSIQQVSQLMRAEDAHILYGPDEFGEYQLRFSSHVAVPAAIARLQSQSGVIDVVPTPDCL